MKNLTFLIGILFVCQMAFSQTTGKQIFHEDFDNNNNGWKNCTISNGQLVTNSWTYLKPITLSEDFMIRTRVSAKEQQSDRVFTIFGYYFTIKKQPNTTAAVYYHFKLFSEFPKQGAKTLYFDRDNGRTQINIDNPLEIKILYINKHISFYANNVFLYESDFDWEKSDIKSIGFIGYPSSEYEGNYTTCSDYLYIDELVISSEERQRRDDKIENDFYTSIKTSKDYDSYLTKYPNGKYFSEISVLKEDYFYNLAISGFISECDNYISKYPSGKYITQIQDLRAERIIYKSALYGSFKEYDAYLLKYPNGKYISEISSLKAKKIYEIDRQNKIKANSNKTLWKTGNKICFESSAGTICGTLMSWNEDKSMIQFKVISGPNMRIEGEQIKPDALIWITPNIDWHICLQDEIDASITQNEDPYKYWKLGKKICLSGTKGAWIFKSSVTITGEIIQWNEDKSKVRIRIIDGADGTYYNNETLYNDKMIWDSPNDWKLCN